LGRRTTKRGSAWSNRHPLKIGVDPYIYEERSFEQSINSSFDHSLKAIGLDCTFAQQLSATM
jgi:hypothetical protein